MSERLDDLLERPAWADAIAQGPVEFAGSPRTAWMHSLKS
jgi:hypothetical protein